MGSPRTVGKTLIFSLIALGRAALLREVTQPRRKKWGRRISGAAERADPAPPRNSSPDYS